MKFLILILGMISLVSFSPKQKPKFVLMKCCSTAQARDASMYAALTAMQAGWVMPDDVRIMNDAANSMYCFEIRISLQ